MAEKSGSICFFDLESTGLKADYNSILVGSIKPYGQPAKTFSVVKPGDDKMLVRELRDELGKYTIWVTYYGKMFDIPLLQSRLLKHGMNKLEKKHHLDVYFHMRAHTLTARRSQAHLLTWLDAPEQKMTLSPEVWNQVLKSPETGLRILKARCESDVKGLEALYNKVKHLVINITR